MLYAISPTYKYLLHIVQNRDTTITKTIIFMILSLLYILLRFFDLDFMLAIQINISATSSTIHADKICIGYLIEHRIVIFITAHETKKQTPKVLKCNPPEKDRVNAKTNTKIKYSGSQFI